MKNFLFFQVLFFRISIIRKFFGYIPVYKNNYVENHSRFSAAFSAKMEKMSRKMG